MIYTKTDITHCNDVLIENIQAYLAGKPINVVS